MATRAREEGWEMCPRVSGALLRRKGSVRDARSAGGKARGSREEDAFPVTPHLGGVQALTPAGTPATAGRTYPPSPPPLSLWGSAACSGAAADPGTELRLRQAGPGAPPLPHPLLGAS